MLQRNLKTGNICPWESQEKTYYMTLNIPCCSLAFWRWVIKRRQWKKINLETKSSGVTSVSRLILGSSNKLTSHSGNLKDNVLCWLYMLPWLIQSYDSRPFLISQVHFITLEQPKMYTLHVGPIRQGLIFGKMNVFHLPIKITVNN